MVNTWELGFWPRVALGAPISCHHNYVAEETHFGEELRASEFQLPLDVAVKFGFLTKPVNVADLIFR